MQRAPDGPRVAVLVDAMVVIEAVRTGCWNAITGRLAVETVERVCQEVLKPNLGRKGFVDVMQANVARMQAVHAVSEDDRAAFALAYDGAFGLDAGERDLVAHAIQRPDDGWRVCTHDMAAIRAAVKLGWGDRLCALEELAETAGQNPNPALAGHFSKKWLASERVKHLLG